MSRVKCASLVRYAGGKFAAVLSDRQHVINDVIDLLEGSPVDPGQFLLAQIAHDDETPTHHKRRRAAAQDGTIGHGVIRRAHQIAQGTQKVVIDCWNILVACEAPE